MKHNCTGKPNLHRSYKNIFMDGVRVGNGHVDTCSTCGLQQKVVDVLDVDVSNKQNLQIKSVVVKKFLLWDGRAKNEDFDNAIIMATADTEDEANKVNLCDGIWYEYDEEDGRISNPKPRPDLGKND